MLEGVCTLERKIKATELGKNLFIGRERNERKKRIYIYISMSENLEPHIGHIEEKRKELKKISVNRETSVDANSLQGAFAE